jgi:hypothetical protein
LSILPQFDGSPGIQALLLSLLSIVSGTTGNLLKTTVGARARDCLLARQMLCEGFRLTFGAVLGRLTGPAWSVRLINCPLPRPPNVLSLDAVQQE